MEQRLDATYLRHSPFERAAAVALGASGVGAGIFLAAWGISFFWRYTPPEIAVRVAIPEVRLVHNEPLTVKQDKPFVLSQPDPLKIEHGQVVVKVEQPATFPSNDRLAPQTAAGDAIKREVTVFSYVQ